MRRTAAFPRDLATSGARRCIESFQPDRSAPFHGTFRFGPGLAIRAFLPVLGLVRRLLDGTAVAVAHPSSAPRARDLRYEEWTEQRARLVAASFGVRLGAEHWRVIGCARELWSATRRPLDLELLATRSGSTSARVAALFGDPAGERLRAIAGIEE